MTLKSTSVFGSVNFTLGFWCYSLALNVIATALIVARLASFRCRHKHLLGSQHARQYTGIMAMVVESELLYTAYLIVYIVPFALDNTVVNAFVQGPAVIQVCLAPITLSARRLSVEVAYAFADNLRSPSQRS